MQDWQSLSVSVTRDAGTTEHGRFVGGKLETSLLSQRKESDRFRGSQARLS